LFMELDCDMIEALADAVVVLPNYSGSSGTAMEIQFATDRDIPVFYLGNHDFCFAMDRDIPLFRLDEKAAKMILERIEY